MPRKLKPGDKAGKYTIKKEMNIGAMAIAYEANDQAGEQVFLKLYKSPTVTKDWYRGYVQYQKTLKDRIESSTAQNFTYRFIDFFEHKIGAGSPVYFQAFEFVKGGENLEDILESVKRDKKVLGWDQRLIMAKVFIAGIHHLHKAGVVHCDLKPANVQLFRDPHIKAGYRLKIIDMDFSILPDIKAPWDGDQGYVGSPNYFSPEHLLPGKTPNHFSDIFTCGLILHEMLAKSHPYASEDDEIYKTKALGGLKKFPILDDAPEGEVAENIKSIIVQCLSPDPRLRPTAETVLLVLNGRKAAGEVSLNDSPPDDVAGVPDDSSSLGSTEEPPISVESTFDSNREMQSLSLVCGSRRLQLNITTAIGKHLLKQFGDEARFYDSHQYVIERQEEGWFIMPNPDAANETLLNGEIVTTRQPILHEDILSVGRFSKGISKLPLKVELM